MKRPILEARDLHVGFNSVKAADGVSLDIHEGEFLVSETTDCSAGYVLF